jgi:hypothetical protein
MRCIGLVMWSASLRGTRYLHAATARVRAVFGERVVGFYTTGSLTLTDYRSGRVELSKRIQNQNLGQTPGSEATRRT